MTFCLFFSLGKGKKKLALPHEPRPPFRKGPLPFLCVIIVVVLFGREEVGRRFPVMKGRLRKEEEESPKGERRGRKESMAFSLLL